MSINKFITREVWIILLCTVAWQYSQGQAISDYRKSNKSKVKDQPLALDRAVRTGKLPNGFTYYIRHNEEPKNRVILYLANKIGSLVENDEQQGLAHFIEHMSFNGTTHYPKNELVNYLQRAGVRFGADLNAYTSFDETVYQLPIPSNNPEILAHGMQIMRDWAQGATLDPVEIDKERGVVLEEKRLGKGAEERMQRQYWPLILNNSRYATRIPIGKEEILTSFRSEVLRSYYHDWYRPNLQALIVVGDVNVNDMERMIKSMFSDLRNPKQQRARTRFTIPLTGKPQFLAVTDREMVSTQVEIIIKQKSRPLRTGQDYSNEIKKMLFNQMLEARFAEHLRSSNPAFISGGAVMGGFVGDLESLDVTVTAKPGELEKGFVAVWREIERVKRFGFKQSELNRAKDNYLRRMESAVREKNKTASAAFVEEYLQYFLKGIAAPGIETEYQLAKSYLPLIQLADIDSLFQGKISVKDRDVIVMAPDKDKAALPTESQMNQWINKVEKETLRPYEDETSRNVLLPASPIPGKITGSQTDRSGLKILTLSNGVKVILKPTAFKNNEIIFSGFAPGGTSLYDDTDYESAAAAELIPTFGVGNYNATQLSKYMSGKQAGVQPFISETIQGFNGGAINNDLETALLLVYGYFTSPRKDSVQFESMRSRVKASLANRADNPDNVFEDTVMAVLGNHSIRRTGPSIEKVNSAVLDKMYSIFKERFAGAGGFTFVFVGSIDTVTIKPLLEKYLGGLPSLKKEEQARDLNIHPPGGIVERIVYKGSEPKAKVNLVFSGTFDYNMVNKLKLDALKEVLEIRLIERLREDEGEVYSPSVRVVTDKYPQNTFRFLIMFGCAPQNVDKLISSVQDEINKLKNSGPAENNLEKFKAEAGRSLEIEQQSNEFWLDYLTSQLQNKEGINQIEDYPAAVQHITVDDIRQSADLYLSGKNFIKLVLLPEKGQGE